MSDSYADFAEFYDRLQVDVPYGEMAGYIHELIQEHSSEKEVVVDLACGTGNLSGELVKFDYDVIGVDISEQMLNAAKNKGGDITYLCQSMTELELWGQADVIVCALDSLNHLPDIKALEETFARVEEYTYKGGLFIFDVNTRYKHREILGDNAFVYDMGDLYCVWQNELNEDDSVNISLDFFARDGQGKYSRTSEEFTEICFDEEQLDQLLKKSGFAVIDIFDGYSRRPLEKNSQRALYVCRKL